MAQQQLMFELIRNKCATVLCTNFLVLEASISRLGTLLRSNAMQVTTLW
jgi:hypothetical protein